MFRQKLTKHKISKVYGEGFADWLFKSEEGKLQKLKKTLMWKLDAEVADEEGEYGLIYADNKYACYEGVKIINLSKDQIIEFYLPFLEMFSLYEKRFSLNPMESYIVGTIKDFKVKKDLIPLLQFEVGDLYWKYGDNYPTSRICPLEKLKHRWQR